MAISVEKAKQIVETCDKVLLRNAEVLEKFGDYHHKKIQDIHYTDYCNSLKVLGLSLLTHKPGNKLYVQ